MVTAKSGKKVWWKCSICGHEWQAIINRRACGTGCPICTGQTVFKDHNDLATIYPNIAKEWDYGKNDNLRPDMVTAKSGKKVWWKCSICGHEWQAVVKSRTTNGRGCPVCAGKKVLKDYNDLATTHPEIAAEWNCKKNGDLLPSMVTAGSDKKVWWKCTKGHEWQAQIKSRSRGIGCPICAAERQASFPENAIAYYLMLANIKFEKNHRPAWINGKEFDIYIPEITTAIEYDGQYYHQDIEKDLQKTQLTQKNNVRLIRIRERDCPEIFGEIITRHDFTDQSLTDAIRILFDLLKIRGIDIGINRDRTKIEEYINERLSQNLTS